MWRCIIGRGRGRDSAVVEGCKERDKWRYWVDGVNKMRDDGFNSED